MNITGVAVSLRICRARPNPDPSGSVTSTIARSQAPAAISAFASPTERTHFDVSLLALEALGQRAAQRCVVFDEQHARH